MTDRFALFKHGLIGLVVPASIYRVRQPPDIEVMLGQVEMAFVMSDPVKLDAVDRVALTAGKRRIMELEILVERGSGLSGLVDQFPVSGHVVIRRGDFEEAIVDPWVVFHDLQSRIDLAL